MVIINIARYLIVNFKLDVGLYIFEYNMGMSIFARAESKIFKSIVKILIQLF